MRITDSVYFDGDSLAINVPTKVIYSGYLCDDEPKEIYMHFGYGLLWDNLQEIKLNKGLNGYEGDIEFTDDNLVFFCFRSSNDKWDNNNGENYIAEVIKEIPIFPPTDSMALIEMPRLKSAYLIKKKIRITFYKIIQFIGKIFSGRILKYSKEKGEN